MAKRSGDGSIFERVRRGKTAYVAQIRWTDPDGRAREMQIQRSTRAEAVVALRNLRVQASSAVVPTADERAITVGDAVNTWIKSKERVLRPSSLRQYRLIEKHLKPLTNQRIATITRNDVRAVAEANHLSPRLRALCRVVLRASLRPHQHLIRGDLFPPRTLPRATHRSMHVWDIAQVRTFLRHTTADRLHLLWRLALGTGMRQGEILRLRWREVHDGWIEVVGATKTTGSRRRIHLDTDLHLALEEARGKAGDFVFATSTGTAFMARNLVRAFKSAIQSVNEQEVISATAEGRDPVVIPDVRFHDLRHTHATALLGANVHPKVVSERLGHASIRLTLDTYSHVMPSMQTEAASVIGDLFGGKSGTKSGTKPKLRAVG